MTYEENKIKEGELESEIRKPKFKKVGEVIKELQKFNPEDQFVVSSDEELNTLYRGFEIARVEDETPPRVVIYGLSGQELED